METEMTNELTYNKWKREVKAYAWSLRYPITIDSDNDPWQDYYDAGYSPGEAVREDMSCCD